MINYIIQVLLFQALFLAVYDFFLQKETFFKWNRVYLIVTPLLSFLIPLLKLQSVQQVVSQDFIVQLPEVVLNPQVVIEQTVQNVTTFDYLQLLFWVGVVVCSIGFVWKLKKIVSLINNNKIVKKQDVNLVLVKDKQSAFSFFNYIFIHPSFLNKKKLKIIQHEIIHSRHYHTLDLLFFEVLRIVMWFNPFIYVYQNRITVLHEYISDAEILKETDKTQYFNQLLSETFNIEKISFINQFYKHSLIKKRIVMIAKNKSQKIKQLKYLLVVPLLFGMLIYTSCVNETENSIQEIEEILKNDIPNEGKYRTLSSGEVVFFGTHLNGERIAFEDYTESETKLAELVREKKIEGIKFEVVKNSKGERVQFLKFDFKDVKKEETIDYSKAEEVPFAIIDEVPVFPGCEGTKEELKKCFQEKLSRHIAKEFNTSLAKTLNLKSKNIRIIALFEIDKEGNVTNIIARAPHKSLVVEAERTIATLPKFEPGKQSGKAVKVKYSLPIAFKVE